MSERVDVLVIDGLDRLEIRLFGVVLLGVVVLGVDGVGGGLAVQGHTDGRTEGRSCAGGIEGDEQGNGELKRGRSQSGEEGKKEEGRIRTGNVAEFFPGEPSVGGRSRDRQPGVLQLYECHSCSALVLPAEMFAFGSVEWLSSGRHRANKISDQ